VRIYVTGVARKCIIFRGTITVHISVTVFATNYILQVPVCRVFQLQMLLGAVYLF
jgi:hypothetical protein